MRVTVGPTIDNIFFASKLSASGLIAGLNWSDNERLMRISADLINFIIKVKLCHLLKVFRFDSHHEPVIVKSKVKVEKWVHRRHRKTNKPAEYGKKGKEMRAQDQKKKKNGRERTEMSFRCRNERRTKEC
jgi:hypothetical protein